MVGGLGGLRQLRQGLGDLADADPRDAGVSRMALPSGYGGLDLVDDGGSLAFEDAGLLGQAQHTRSFVMSDLALYFAMSLRALRGRTLMTFRAGLALNICSCLVNGLMPL